MTFTAIVYLKFTIGSLLYAKAFEASMALVTCVGSGLGIEVQCHVNFNC